MWKLTKMVGLFMLAQMPSAAEVAEKWARRGQAAGQDFVQGVQRVQTAPGQAAAAKADKWFNSIQQAHASGLWKRRVANVSLEAWKARTAEIGGQRFAQGVQAAQGKMQAAMERILPIVETVRNSVRQMPDDTLDARIQRSVAFQRELSQRARQA